MLEWTAHQAADPERFVWRMLRHKARPPSAPGSEAGKTHVTICVKRIQLGISCIALLVQKSDVGGQQPFLQHQAGSGERIALLGARPLCLVVVHRRKPSAVS